MDNVNQVPEKGSDMNDLVQANKKLIREDDLKVNILWQGIIWR